MGGVLVFSFKKIFACIYFIKNILRAQINEELAKSNFDFVLEFNLICI